MKLSFEDERSNESMNFIVLSLIVAIVTANSCTGKVPEKKVSALRGETCKKKNGVTAEYGFLVSKETVVLRRWERSQQKFGFIKRVVKGWITTVKDLESWRFER